MLHCSICCEYTSATVCCGEPTLDLSSLPIIAESQGAAIQQPTPTIDQVLAAMTAEQAAPWPTRIDAWLDLGMPIEEITQRLLDAMRPDDKADWFAEVRHWLDQGCSYDEIAGWLPEADASDDAWNLARGIL